MKLILSNFKSHRDVTVDLSGGRGAAAIGGCNWVLVNGRSGSGKSTLFDAIAYVLYGVGQKLATYGTKTPMRVEMHLGDTMVITRGSSTGLSLLLLGPSLLHQGQFAQSHIDREFGQYDIFRMAAILEQKSAHNFVSLPPIARSRFVELMSCIDLTKIKDEIKTTRTRVSHELMFEKGQKAAMEQAPPPADDTLLPPIDQQTFSAMTTDLAIKRRANDKSVQATRELQQLGAKTSHPDTETRLVNLKKLHYVHETIKKNTQNNIKCPNCSVCIGTVLNESLQSKLVKYTKMCQAPANIQAEIKICESQLAMKQRFETQQAFLQSQIIQPLHDIDQLQNNVEFYKNMFNRSNHDVHALETIDRKIATMTTRLTSLDQLKSKIDIAQTQFNKNIIDTFSLHANEFIAGFFDKPAVLSITSFSKTGRPQIDFEITYDGRVMDLKSLSGGEFDRVLLAMTLGINKIVACPFILLDETLGSLDAETMRNVISTTRRNYPGTVVYIGHVDDYGLFDTIIGL